MTDLDWFSPDRQQVGKTILEQTLDSPSSDSLVLDEVFCKGSILTVSTKSDTTKSGSRISWVPLVDSLEDRLLDKSLSVFSE